MNNKYVYIYMDLAVDAAVRGKEGRLRLLVANAGSQRFHTNLAVDSGHHFGLRLEIAELSWGRRRRFCARLLYFRKKGSSGNSNPL
jgi:hypothetical protein